MNEKTASQVGEEQQAAMIKEAAPKKPNSIQIALMDNGWLVGVHYHPQVVRDYGCGPSKQFVFTTADSLARGLQQLVEGHEPNWLHEAWLVKRHMQFDDLQALVRKNPVIFNACVGEDVVDALVHFVNRKVQEDKFKKE